MKYTVLIDHLQDIYWFLLPWCFNNLVEHRFTLITKLNEHLMLEKSLQPQNINSIFIYRVLQTKIQLP